MNKYKSLYLMGIIVISLIVFAIGFFIYVLTSNMEWDSISVNTKVENFTPKVDEQTTTEPEIREIIKIDTIYIEKKIEIPCKKEHCEVKAVKDSIVP